MLANGQTVIGMMEKLAPKHVAEEGDKIGLQVGTLQKNITGVLVTLDVNDKVVDEAIQLGANLIIAHHAVIFRPLQHLQTDNPMGRLVEKLIKHDIAVYISHTNLDITEGGLNDWMAEALGIQEASILKEVHQENLYKLVVFVPKDHHQKVLDAILNAGAGSIGNYSHCSFLTEGSGSFLPMEGAKPFIGSPGKLAQVVEMRIETIVSQGIRNKVIQAMLKAHPYEEVAYDLYPIEQKGRSFGLGRVGYLQEPVSLSAYVETVKTGLGVGRVRVCGDLNRSISKVAVLGGAGSKFLNSALFKGADVFVTGDVDFHTAQDALMAGIAMIDPGHHAEKMMKHKVAQWMQDRLSEKKSATRVYCSAVDTDPFCFM
ncbi:MAG: Nif3-like dinuclear metal center hexameric protein [Gorillibacterium sp.]|nr:Nif3-like dinuclear metal center hexameric protein [Gorillibacterium sp.]